MGTLLAKATIQGIDFTFERLRCGQWCAHAGRSIGMASSEKHTSTRIGVCPIFIGTFTVEVWGKSEVGEEHIQHILAYRQEEADKKVLYDKAKLRPGDSIVREYRSREDSYSFRVRGLSRDQALRAYKAAMQEVNEVRD